MQKNESSVDASMIGLLKSLGDLEVDGNFQSYSNRLCKRYCCFNFINWIFYTQKDFVKYVMCPIHGNQDLNIS